MNEVNNGYCYEKLYRLEEQAHNAQILLSDET